MSQELTFHQLTYKVRQGKNDKVIVDDVSGRFRSAQLTAILGPSGAGKTSLMNMLAGRRRCGGGGSGGVVRVDGLVRDERLFRKTCAYIPQSDHLLPHLSVDEYLTVAARLKLGRGTSEAARQDIIDRIVKTLGLLDCRSTRVHCLSGGEKKRLAIGLELVHNPSVLFLDEPTSGLDSSSSLQCVSLLKEIARSGRIVVATVHQPSARLLQLFDHLYVVAAGKCIYQGPVDHLVPYLQTMDLTCPSYHNPADFVIDVASGEYGTALVARLVAAVDNGRSSYRAAAPEAAPAAPPAATAPACHSEAQPLLGGRTEPFGRPVRFHTQTALLLKRTFQCIWREKMLTLLRLVAHAVVGVLMGLLYWRTGDDASAVYNNAGLLFFNQLFLLFTAMMPTVLTFPLERQVLLREHSNRWYSLKSYYLAKTTADIPFQVAFPVVYLVTVYFMTEQPAEWGRLLMILAVSIANSLVAQAVGLLVGAAADVQVAVFAAPAATIPFLLFSGFFVTLSAVPWYLQWLTYASFMRYAFEGCMVAVYGFNRPNLHCGQPYCHFKSPSKFLLQMDMVSADSDWLLLRSLAALAVLFVAVRAAAYGVLVGRVRAARR